MRMCHRGRTAYIRPGVWVSLWVSFWTMALGSVAHGVSFQGLGDLPGGGFFSQAFGVSADGSVVVGVGTSPSGTEAFRWTQAGGMVGLGGLVGPALFSIATAVSADGSVVVGESTSASGEEAFRWTQAGGMVGLGDLPGGALASFATAVSADGSVVVGRGMSALGGEAFMWDSVHGMRNLSDVLVGDFGLGASLTGWTLTQATAISPDGLAIVGFGTNPIGETEAWIANLGPAAVPEPSTLLFVGSGLAALATWRRFKRACVHCD